MERGFETTREGGSDTAEAYLMGYWDGRRNDGDEHVLGALIIGALAGATCVAVWWLLLG